MTDKENVFIDLSKCSEEQRKHIISLLPKPENSMQYRLFWKFKYLHFSSDLKKWIVQSDTENKTKLTYPDFIKLFEGGEGENNGWIKIESEADLPKETGFYYAYNKVGKHVDIDYMDWDYDDHSERWMEFNSHYQPIILPEPPKF